MAAKKKARSAAQKKNDKRLSELHAANRRAQPGVAHRKAAAASEKHGSKVKATAEVKKLQTKIEGLAKKLAVAVTRANRPSRDERRLAKSAIRHKTAHAYKGPTFFTGSGTGIPTTMASVGTMTINDIPDVKSPAVQAVITEIAGLDPFGRLLLERKLQVELNALKRWITKHGTDEGFTPPQGHEPLNVLVRRLRLLEVDIARASQAAGVTEGSVPAYIGLEDPPAVESYLKSNPFHGIEGKRRTGPFDR